MVHPAAVEALAEDERKLQDELERRAAAKRHLQDERKRQRIESLLRREAVKDEINFMSGLGFERFMADVFKQKGYGVQETPTNDQGVDLLLDMDSKRVAVQLKRWTGPVGYDAARCCPSSRCRLALLPSG